MASVSRCSEPAKPSWSSPLNYLAEERPILSHAIYLCGLDARVLLVFDAVFDNNVTVDAGWSVLKVTSDQLATEWLRDLPPLPSEPKPDG